MFFATLGVIASSIENVAIEIRHMQRTEVLEAEEFFSPRPEGSSAMPHKRNTVLTENLTGLARLVRMSVVPRRSGKRCPLARARHQPFQRRTCHRPGYDDYTRLRAEPSGRRHREVVIYPDNMLKNMNKFRGSCISQRVLLALTQAGVSREDSYRLVQRNAMKVWEQGKDFLEELLADAEVRAALSEDQIREKFDLGYHTKHVDTIFRRVFG